MREISWFALISTYRVLYHTTTVSGIIGNMMSVPQHSLGSLAGVPHIEAIGRDNSWNQTPRRTAKEIRNGARVENLRQQGGKLAERTVPTGGLEGQK